MDMGGRKALRAAVPILAAAAALAPQQAAARTSVPALPAELIDASLAAEGESIRSEPGVRVERVTFPARQRAAHPGLPGHVWRVRLTGSFPPRALRYAVLADGRPVGYGLPGPGERSLVAITADPAVRTARLSARYGDAEASAGTATAPHVRGATARAGEDDLEEGPYAVERATYDLGDEAFVPSRFDHGVELVGAVHHPAGLPDGPYPLVLFLHGNHSSCYRGQRTRFQWPCPGAWTPLPNHEGYDYVARRLASFGFVVASVSANGVNVHGSRLRSTGMRQRGELLQRHLDLWRDWSTTGGDPFGTDFVGNVDLERIGTMGHSRGGEGAIWQTILDRHRPDPYGIDAVLPLAPVDFTRRTVSGVPLSVMLPYCDGDVSDLQGIHFFDDARYRREGDPAPKHTVTVFGANHNFFNTVWTPGEYPGSFDDGNRPCGMRLDPEGQRRVGALFIADFFRRYLTDALELDPLWIGAEPPSELAPDQALVSYHAPDLPDRRRDLDRFTGPGDLLVNTLGGGVAAREMALYEWCAGTWRDPCVPGRFRFFDTHLEGLSQGVLGWRSNDASVRFRIPQGQGDMSALDALQLRVSPNPGYPLANGVQRQNFVVELTDRAGVSASVPASHVGRQALTYPPGLQRFSGHVILNQLRFRLELFPGVDLGDIRSVEIEFSRRARGALNVADLAFTAGAE
jgi:hypothetical protein